MNLIILGCGRSGTSLLSGLFAGAGYFPGSRLHPARDSNPAGFFESGEINDINNRILGAHESVNGLSGWVGVYEEPVRTLPDDVRPRIEAEIAHTPFCFKDPRFSYTLPAWESQLGAFTVLCVFREPGAVVDSLVKECTTYYPQYGMTDARAEQVWRSNYLNVFERLEPRHRVLHVRYEDLLDGVGIAALESRLGVALDRGLVRRDLDRNGGGAAPGAGPVSAAATARLSPATHEVHARLMELRI